MNELHLLAMSYVFFLGLIGGEVAVSLFRRDGGYRISEAIVNVGHGVVYQVWDAFTKVLVMVPFLWVGSLVPWETLPIDSPVAWLVGLLLYDFCSYWIHRHHHEISILWAIHGNHHAAEDYNLAAGLRQAMLQNAFKWLWRMPLALVIPVDMYIGLIVFDYLYQFLQHTQYVPKLGPIGWVMNTPSHHRVHHGRQEKYIDKNYGGILIIWDRLLGTFQPEEETPDYGITKPIGTVNAVHANFVIFSRLVSATERARGWDKVRVWLGATSDLDRIAPGGEPARFDVIENADVPLRLRIYVVATSLLVPPLLGWMLLSGDTWPLIYKVAMAALIITSVVSAGALLERKSWAVWLEAVRWLAAGTGFGLVLGSALPLVVVASGLVTLVIATGGMTSGAIGVLRRSSAR